MIGVVSPEWRPLLRVCFFDAGGAIQEIECWLDTGFDGGLLLPRANVTALGLSGSYDITALLANGSAVETQLYPAMILWDGERRRVQVIEAEGHPLIGLHLLHDHEIRISLTVGGAVSIEAID